MKQLPIPVVPRHGTLAADVTDLWRRVGELEQRGRELAAENEILRTRVAGLALAVSVDEVRGKMAELAARLGEAERAAARYGGVPARVEPG